MLEETPDVTFADIGGLDSEIGRIRDAVQLPFQHRALFERYDLKPPKGVLLYGPPGNGKTMIAKAVANALCEGGYDSNGDGAISPAETHVKGVFLSVKGPELLNKYVGESGAPVNAPRTAIRWSCSSMRWIRCYAPAAPASPPMWRPRLCPSSSPNSTAWNHSTM